ncbi:DUF6262 family protein [Streptomyces werraensis]|uniref:DUF6262 family protein n=1 Tax=Streptomyces werraensis TaxID=68284 RepID=UPI003825F3A9
MNTVPEPRTAAALAARRGKTDTALLRVRESITRLQREKARVSVAAVARRANVSRTFLYANPEARGAIATAIAEAGECRTRMLADQEDAREATWRERALNAEEALKSAQTEILTQRTESANSAAKYWTCKPSGPKRPSSGSPPRTPPSNNESAS